MMYVKLALRNARRSASDYLLYITTMAILFVIMIMSNSFAVLGDVRAGFQTSSLPFLIGLIMVILVGYMNRFMLKQRGKEFASYMLLGLEKETITWMFLLEFFFIGMICFLISAAIGLGLFFVITEWTVLFPVQDNIPLTLFGQSLAQAFLYFCIIEALSAFHIKNRIYKLEIRELMIEKKRNQKTGRKHQYRFWGLSFITSFFCFLLMLCGIVFLPGNAGSIFISIVAVPLLFTIFTFYKWIFQYMALKRQNQQDCLYCRERIYIISNLTSQIKTNAIMNGIFSVCLIFSSTCFIFGILMFLTGHVFYDSNNQWWMGFLQINLCIIFIVIYFSILSLQFIIELQQQKRAFKILYDIGWDKTSLKMLIRKQALIKLTLPALIFIPLFLLSIPLLNYKMNIILPEHLNHILLKAAFGFLVCFFIFYIGYYYILWLMGKRCAEDTLQKKSAGF